MTVLIPATMLPVQPVHLVEPFITLILSQMEFRTPHSQATMLQLLPAMLRVVRFITVLQVTIILISKTQVSKTITQNQQPELLTAVRFIQLKIL